MPLPFPTVDVSSWEVVQEEPGGETAKDWLRDPVSGRTWLYKSVTIKKLSDGRTYRRGQDWAEKAAAEIAGFLGLPAATVEMARRNGIPGLISLDLKSDGSSLNEAADYLAALDKEYVPWTADNKIKDRVGHNLANVHRLLDGVEAPPESLPDVAAMTAREVFVGFLLFDALIANVDRHDRNWAIVRTESGRDCLSATYDHGSALGSGLDEKRRRAYATDVPGWCRKGFAHRFEGAHKTTLLDLALEFATDLPDAYAYWRQQVIEIDCDEVAHMLSRVPVMSDLERTFALNVISENQGRIRL